MEETQGWFAGKSDRLIGGGSRIGWAVARRFSDCTQESHLDRMVAGTVRRHSDLVADVFGRMRALKLCIYFLGQFSVACAIQSYGAIAVSAGTTSVLVLSFWFA